MKFAIDYPTLRPMFWAQNRHVQTLAAFFLKQQKTTRFPYKRKVTLRDGDAIVIQDDDAKSWITGDRIAILVHGLCGCHNSSYVRRIGIRLRQHGIRTIRIDMRGFGDSSLISRGHIHAGGSNDLADVVRHVNQLSPLSKLTLIGFSLGGNILLKYLTEQSQSDLEKMGVDSAIAVSPPIDLEYCSAHLRANGNRIYESYFVKKLTSGLQHRRRFVKNLVDNGMNPMPDRLVHFDDQFTAPVNGFGGARDYYRKCSTHSKLQSIKTPTMIVATQDDPVVPYEIFDTSAFSSSTQFVFTKFGGHLGFLGHHTRDPDRHWLDWRICQWIGDLTGS
ncbi:MAG: alpha/beta fold hydrolase [Planctomycetota bacterium]